MSFAVGFPRLPSFGPPVGSVPVTSFPVTSSSVEVQPIAPACAPCAQPIYTAPPRPICPPTVVPLSIPPPPAPLPLPQSVDIRIVDDRTPKTDALEEELRSVRHQLSISEDNELRLKRQLQEAQAKLKVWMQKEGQIGGLEAEIARLREQIFEGDLRLVNSEGQRAGMAELVARLERDLHVASGRLGEAQQLEVELAELQRQLLEARARNAGLEQEQYRFQSAISALESQLNEANDRRFQVKAQLQSEIAGLREQLAAAQQRYSDLERARLEGVNKVSILEAKLREAESRLNAADQRIQSLLSRIAALEAEIANLRARLTSKPELHSSTSVKETYKVKSFEVAAKLAVMDGTDDGMYNGLPIEVEGEGLYKDLVAKGRRPRGDVGHFGSLTASTSETYKVNSYEMAERLSRMDGTDDGKYNGLPIEVVGQGLYTDLRRAGGFKTTTFSGGFTSGGGGYNGTSSPSSMGVKGSETYIVTSVDIAATLSKMSGKDDGTYKGLPIEVKGLGLYRDLRARR